MRRAFLIAVVACGLPFLASGENVEAPEITPREPSLEGLIEDLTLDDFRPRARLSREEFIELAEEVVARVDGRDIKRKNVWEVFKVSPDSDTVPPFNRRLLWRAVERELLYLEALRREIDRTDEFRERLEEQQARRWRNRVPVVAGAREREMMRKFISAVEPAEPAEEEIDAVFTEARPRFPEEITDKEVKDTIRDLLASQGPMVAYQEWLAGLFEDAKIAFRGESLAVDDIAESLKSFSIREGVRGIRAGEREAEMLLAKIKEEAAGLEELSTLRLSVNGERVETRGLDEESGRGALEVALELFTTVKNYLIAQDTRDRDELPEEKPVWETPMEKSILISLTISKLVEEEPEPELSRDEIRAFYQAHPRYHGMTLEGLKARMIPRMISEKRRQSAIDRLRDRFKVEILVEFD